MIIHITSVQLPTVSLHTYRNGQNNAEKLHDVAIDSDDLSLLKYCCKELLFLCKVILKRIGLLRGISRLVIQDKRWMCIQLVLQMFCKLCR